MTLNNPPVAIPISPPWVFPSVRMETTSISSAEFKPIFPLRPSGELAFIFPILMCSPATTLIFPPPVIPTVFKSPVRTLPLGLFSVILLLIPEKVVVLIVLV